MRQAVLAERQGDGTPQGAERGEDQQRERSARPEDRFLGEKRQRGPQQPPVAHAVSGGGRGGQDAVQHDRDQHGHAGGHHVHRAPAGDVGQRPGNRACQQDPEDDAGRHEPDHPSSSGRIRQRRRERDQELGHHREHADRRHPGEQDQAVRGGRGDQFGDREQRQQPGDEPTAFEQVTERDQQEQAQAVAELRERDDAAHGRRGDPEIGAHGDEQRLREVDRGDGRPGGHGEQQDDSETHYPSSVVSTCYHWRR
ncbi:hypothetical protein C791_6543 [Amycolatopsis azurea DSM 43854]|uniref:Uncharacterized protein n=1 Tax=Amycolatopsis azurea DSM 43854 TaxID=1238180 RepID=M2NNW8_9PSEU|nr:hypothetical protein C791_6543 [Amycolatopsis azurea DSM 43854]